MKGLLVGAFVLAGSQAALLTLCTSGRCGAAGLGPSLLFGGVVAVLAGVMVRSR